MDVLGAFLDSRGEPSDWRPVALPPEERLVKFDSWLRRKLAERIDWSWAGTLPQQVKRIEQARLYVERLIMALWRRGWLLDGTRLAQHILTPLDLVAEYQKKGQIKEFWPYFCATIDRYVGVNSEEIQVETRQVGATMDGLLSKLGVNKVQNSPSLPELLALRANEVEVAKTSLREKQRAYRAANRPLEDLESGQMPLL